MYGGVDYLKVHITRGTGTSTRYSILIITATAVRAVQTSRAAPDRIPGPADAREEVVQRPAGSLDDSDPPGPVGPVEVRYRVQSAPVVLHSCSTGD